MSIAVQTAVGEVGYKAVTELSFAFAGMVDCGGFQYGVNSSGVHLLNTGETDNLAAFERSFTLATTDLGVPNKKRVRRVYAEVEIFEDCTFTLTDTLDKGTALTKTIAATGTGLKKLHFTLPRDSAVYHTIKLSSTSRFRVHKLSGLIIVRALTVR